MGFPTLQIQRVLLALTLSGIAHSAQAKLYAVLVGVEDYEHADLRSPPLKYAVDDAADFAKVLRGHGYQVIVLTDDAGKTNPKVIPNRANIFRAVKGVLANCQRGDTVVVGLAGHGLQFAGEQEAYFCPIDARPFANKRESLVSIRELYTELDASFAGAKIVLVDACRNDPDPTRGRDALAADTVPPPRGVGVLFSCAPGQRAYENDSLKHGIFFYHVIEQLRGAGPLGIGFSSFSESTTSEVMRTAARLNIPAQTPNQQGNIIGVPFLVPPSNDRPEAPSAPQFIAGQELSDNSLSMKFCWCPPGSFLMGSPDSDPDADEDEKPQHRVTLTQGFWLGKYEVTQAEWEAVMNTSPWLGEDYVLDSPRAPATFVSWNDATEFCNRLTARDRQAGRLPAGERYTLPTEAQWEYACRAGSVTRWSFGDDDSKSTTYGWYQRHSFNTDEKYAHEVGQKRSNRWNFHDLHGNVWEWCADWYDADYYSRRESPNPIGPPDGGDRVLRGGPWSSGPAISRSADRAGFTPDNRNYSFIGFRLSRTK